MLSFIFSNTRAQRNISQQCIEPWPCQVNEGAVGGFLTAIYNFVGIVFLFLFFIPVLTEVVNYTTKEIDLNDGYILDQYNGFGAALDFMEWKRFSNVANHYWPCQTVRCIQWF